VSQTKRQFVQTNLAQMEATSMHVQELWAPSPEHILKFDKCRTTAFKIDAKKPKPAREIMTCTANKHSVRPAKKQIRGTQEITITTINPPLIPYLITMINVYIRNKWRNQIREDLLRILTEIRKSDHVVMVIGDMNETLDPETRPRTCGPHHPKGRKNETFLTNLCLDKEMS